eukprot:TRINITY_DN20158_c0_g1_i1.p1 TRINITY_DN20158_c0_g1~~TRINITY_DN20158_c0_g1_i1.p1  ORF type:complete len:353 (+),score=48.47 TRINITY_DN20158_c0_g1_i1:29-1060(+)
MTEDVEEYVAPEKQNAIMGMKGNDVCADCDLPDPKWASVKLGILLCENCAGNHRQLGTNISRIKSLVLDKWLDSEYAFMESMGNEKAGRMWEYNLPVHFIRPNCTDSPVFLAEWIKLKYKDRAFVKPDQQPSARASEICSTADIHALPLYSGHLYKKGNVRKAWKRRWFELEGSCITYHKKSTGSAALGSILISEDTIVNNIEPVDGKLHCFVIKQKGRDYILSAENGKIVFEWIMFVRSSKFRLVDKNDGKYTASQIKEQDVLRILPTLRLNKKGSKNFHGCNLVDLIVTELDVVSRAQAVVIGQKLMSNGFISGERGVASFQDTTACYALHKDKIQKAKKG